MDPRRKVEAGYDRMAEGYLQARERLDPNQPPMPEALIRLLPKSGDALDLGCGAGVPVVRWLATRFNVTGVDISTRQIELARQRVPEATFIRADMTEVDFPPGSFDLIVALHSIIHVPRAEQPALIARIYDWLRPGGAFVGTWATSGWEGEEDNWEGWGASMWWSHYGAEKNVDMHVAAGFTVEYAETITQAGETWLWILARKPLPGDVPGNTDR